jgi:two-component system, cell cycle response regulator
MFAQTIQSFIWVQTLVRLATTDFLTGLSNRRAFFENAAKMITRAQYRHALSAIMFDLDHFKQINNIHSHDTGDVVLKRVAAETALLPGIAGRLGGEEFVLLTESDLADAFDIAQELRRSVERLKIFDGDKPVAVTCSVGVAEWEPGDTIDIVLRRADMALYEAKRTGRNKVVVADTYAHSEHHGQWRGAVRTTSRSS